mmetsp:Transcript_142045/g.247466  ORF Transcript_142045/g.247466 Transcript_142045/m.247466 type:complete len:461 (-) Transcript_142045:57-1439(-)
MFTEKMIEEYNAMVKNTFITISCPEAEDKKPRRCSSLPHLIRLAGSYKSCSPGTPRDSSASTEIRSSDDETSSIRSEAKDSFYDAALQSPRSAWEEGNDPLSCPARFCGDLCAEFPPPPAFSMSPGQPIAAMDPLGCMEDVHLAALSSLNHAKTPLRRGRKLNAKASSFQPGSLEASPALRTYKEDFAGVVERTRRDLDACEDVADVQIYEGVQVWTIIIRPQETHGQMQELLTVSQKSLLASAAQSKCIYVMGYTGHNAFVPKPQGFQASLGAMANATNACWHVFKKGFCRHAYECCKQHPACLVPVNVFVDTTDYAEVQRARDFKQQVGDLVKGVASELSGTFGTTAEASENKELEGWSVEIGVKPDELATSSEYLLNIARNAIYCSADQSQSIYLMGYQTQPFIPSPYGFTATLGDMKDKSCACWDIYSRGSCHRDRMCRWQHPDYFVPVSVQVRAL